MKALVLVDVQNDFVPGGTLPVPEGDTIVALLNQLQPRFDLVVATQDWHPANHTSFASNHPGKKPGDVVDVDGVKQILSLVHCVQNTRGAEFVPGLERSRIDKVFQKGTDPRIDSYSGFFDNGHKKATGLGDFLKSKGVTELFVAGLATDYCVKFTALDARGLGFETFLIVDACRGVNRHPDDSERAVEEMKRAGVQFVRIEISFRV
jgi:nicotinamidase/pyrazinamidase